MNCRKEIFSIRWLALAALPFLTQAVHGQVLFSDNFDVNSSGNYTVNQDADAEVLFAYDYSTLGISAAPNSAGGTTLGLRFRANIDATTGAQAINVSPTGGSFTGNFRMSFDLWINANGPFPAGGGGSTQFGTAGVGTAGTSVQKGSVPADGAWFAVDGEGQSGIDFRAYRGAVSEGPSSTAFFATDSGTINRRSADNPYYHATFAGGQQAPTLQQTTYPASADPANNQEGALKAGTVGFGWRQIEITKVGNDVSWTIDGLPIATLTGATLAGNNIFVGHWDAFSSTTANPAMNFSIVDNWRVEVIPEPSAWMLGLLGAAGLLGWRRRQRLADRTPSQDRQPK
jgi:MYXO-CTERM domain-containing protein